MPWWALLLSNSCNCLEHKLFVVKSQLSITEKDNYCEKYIKTNRVIVRIYEMNEMIVS